LAWARFAWRGGCRFAAEVPSGGSVAIAARQKKNGTHLMMHSIL